jgi:hypothetical protein
VTFRPFRRFPFAMVLSVVLVGGPAYAGMPLANYRTVHDLTLAAGAEFSDSGSIKARLVTEFTGSACAGYTTRLRFVTSSSIGDGSETRTDDIRSVMFESADGAYKFTHETYAEDELVEVSTGTAERTGEGVAVVLSEPEEKSFVLDPGTALPTEQVVRVLAAAVAGKRFVSFDVYDGSEGGEKVYGTATVIGRPSTAADDLGVETSIAEAGFADQRHWPVTISYFQQPAGSEMTPDYTMSLVLYENGITRDLKLDYGAFALDGKLTQLELLPPPPCRD